MAAIASPTVLQQLVGADKAATKEPSDRLAAIPRKLRI
jgi:hypothetical protein